MEIPFVKAVWEDLILLNYAVEDEALAPYLGDLTIDRWNGRGYVSVVGLHFGNAKLLGMVDPILPSIRSFAQWNLRAYIRHNNEPGIVFLKEFVPSTLVTAAVRAFYKENYHTARLREYRSVDADGRHAQYMLDWGGRRHSMSMHAVDESREPDAVSLDHFVMERYLGFPARHRGIHFNVAHRPWRTFPVRSYLIDVDFGLLYGDRWAFLGDRSPESIAWCDGSEVDVMWRKRDV